MRIRVLALTLALVAGACSSAGSPAEDAASSVTAALGEATVRLPWRVEIAGSGSAAAYGASGPFQAECISTCPSES